MQDARALHVRADELQAHLADRAAQVKDLQQSLTDCQQELGDLQRRHSRALRNQGDQSPHLAELQRGWQQQMQEASTRQEQGAQQVHICLIVQDNSLPCAAAALAGCRLLRGSRTQTVGAWLLSCALDLCSATPAAAYLWLQTCCCLLHRLS